jgi:hypothetical protein
LELSREVGESADELTGSVNASVSVFTISDEIKTQVINQFLSSESDFNNIKFNLDDFTLSLKVTKIDSTQATATLTITGSSLPKLDLAQIKTNLIGKTLANANSLIKKLIPRAYNFRINNNFPLLPFRVENIDIEVKTEPL